MRIVAISDIHNKIEQVKLPPADLLLIAGDLTGMGTVKEYVKFNQDLEIIKPLYKYGIVLIEGNHDWLGEKDPGLASSLITNATLLRHELVEINGIRIFGSPYSKFFFNWAFNIHPGKESQEKWAQIPACDILMTHGQAYGILDTVPSGEHVGCHDLLDVILRVKPRYVIGGHIHFSYGEKYFNDITFINASTCDERYKPINPPIEFEI